RHTRAQSRLGTEGARQANVAGAYACLPGVELSGKRVVLVDDVATSGATLAQCAACLRAAGAARVVALTLARAEGGRTGGACQIWPWGKKCCTFSVFCAILFKNGSP